MQIETNKNIDTYKDDFFKGLTLAQTIAAAGILLSAGGTFAVLYVFAGLPMSISIYLSLPFAMPFALAGFLKVRGMSPYAYLQKKTKVSNNPTFVRKPQYLSDAFLYEERQTQKLHTDTGKVILETEEDLFLRSKAYNKLFDDQNT